MLTISVAKINRFLSYGKFIFCYELLLVLKAIKH